MLFKKKKYMLLHKRSRYRRNPEINNVQTNRHWQFNLFKETITYHHPLEFIFKSFAGFTEFVGHF